MCVDMSIKKEALVISLIFKPFFVLLKEMQHRKLSTQNKQWRLIKLCHFLEVL